MARLPKHEFVSYLRFMDIKNNQVDEFCNTLEKLCNTSHCDLYPFADYENLVVRLLRTIMNDKDDIIGFWMYESDYGRNFHIGDVEGDDGSTPDLSTPEALYDFLIKEYSDET